MGLCMAMFRWVGARCIENEESNKSNRQSVNQSVCGKCQTKTDETKQRQRKATQGKAGQERQHMHTVCELRELRETNTQAHPTYFHGTTLQKKGTEEK